MLNSTILIKVKQRLNKLASNDYDNIEPWQIVEAFNKGQTDWCRRNLHGTNLSKEGDEQSTRRVDDLEVLLSTIPLFMTDRKTFYESNIKPANYLQWKRVSTQLTKDCCKKPKTSVIYLAEQANIDELLRDNNKKPSYEWGETFCTQKGGRIQIYTNGEFEITNTQLTYYRQPLRIEISGVTDPYTGITPTADVQSEFKEDLIELFVEEAVKIIAGDIESMNQLQRAGQSVEQNN